MIPEKHFKPLPDWPFLLSIILITGLYIGLLGGMLLADLSFTKPQYLLQALQSPEIQFSIKLSLYTSSIAAILSVWIAVPVGYLMSRFRFKGQNLLDALLDIPIVLPPLVIGISLLILFQTPIGKFVERFISVTYAIPAVVIAQFTVACAFSVRTMRATFDQINPRKEQVALTLGCSRGQAFWQVALPEARKGILTAFTLAWARALGEFGPILVFAGATRMRTEVLPTTVFLELSVGNIESAVAVSLLMILFAVTVLFIIRSFGNKATFDKGIQ